MLTLFILGSASVYLPLMFRNRPAMGQFRFINRSRPLPFGISLFRLNQYLRVVVAHPIAFAHLYFIQNLNRLVAVIIQIVGAAHPHPLPPAAAMRLIADVHPPTNQIRVAVMTMMIVNYARLVSRSDTLRKNMNSGIDLKMVWQPV
jgi:hypothetical protein